MHRLGARSLFPGNIIPWKNIAFFYEGVTQCRVKRGVRDEQSRAVGENVAVLGCNTTSV